MRNKYFIKEGQEELNRALLLMKYDSKKTLTENIKEAEVNEVIPLIPLIASIPGWVAGTAAGGAALTGLGIWISDILGGSNAASKSKIFFDGCKAQSSNLKPTVSKSEYRAAADSIYNAIKGAGTDEDAIKAALASMPTPADLCAMANYYSTTYAEDIYEALDGDIDGSDWVTYVWSPINPKILDAQEDLENAEKDKTGEDKTGEDKKDDGKKNLNTRKPDENTKKIQTMLVNSGYYIGNTGPNKNGVDGYYGTKTKLAYEASNKGESAEDFNQRVYKIGKTQQGGTQQGNVQQGGTQQGNVQQGGTQQGNVQQGGTPEGEINIINPNDF